MHDVLRIDRIATEANDRVAAEVRARLAARGLRSLNLIGSPGSGKTAILEALGRRLGNRLGVVTGDLRTTLDADRIRATGARAVPIETGDTCHLAAAWVAEAIGRMDLSGLSLLVVENVGNLVCPAAFDLGEDAKVAILSVAEGDEKPLKYPALFLRADAVILSKMDLLPHVDFDPARARANCLAMHAHVRIFETSAKEDRGFEEFLDWVSGLVPGRAG